jgi:hypothetical protein
MADADVDDLPIHISLAGGNVAGGNVFRDSFGGISLMLCRYFRRRRFIEDHRVWRSSPATVARSYANFYILQSESPAGKGFHDGFFGGESILHVSTPDRIARG